MGITAENVKLENTTSLRQEQDQDVGWILFKTLESFQRINILKMHYVKHLYKDEVMS